MNKVQTLHAGVFFFIMILLSAQALHPQDSETSYNPRESNLLIDIPLTIGEDMVINLLGNGYWRLWGPDSEVAYFTTDSIKENLNPSIWNMEVGQGGDIFLVNQFLHPYAGGLYFSAARSNNFNFYWSILAAGFGSVMWETLGEAYTPAISDVANTTIGGIAFGEIMHRLYMELDKGGLGSKIAGTLISPADRVTAAVRGYGPERGPSMIYEASVAAGFSWSNAQFLERTHVMEEWNKPAFFLRTAVVYGDPFIQASSIPYEHFEFDLSMTVSMPLMYNFNFTSDGYLASWVLADTTAQHISNGLSLHFDDYVVDKNLDLNNGTENIGFNANSLDYTIKWRRFVSDTLAFSVKLHAGISPWSIADYNGGPERDDYYCYLWGGNVKLGLELRHIPEGGWIEGYETRGQTLSLNLRVYDTWNIPRTPGFKMNAAFGNGELRWVLPLTENFSFYVADTFSVLHINVTREESEQFPDITRWYNSAQVGVQLSF
ncbi:DUF3943 domain-containing protein [Breznakiellaceae bacterium SP9]